MMQENREKRSEELRIYEITKESRESSVESQVATKKKTGKTPQYGQVLCALSFDGSVIIGSKLPDARPSNLHLSGRPYFGDKPRALR